VPVFAKRNLYRFEIGPKLSDKVKPDPGPKSEKPSATYNPDPHFAIFLKVNVRFLGRLPLRRLPSEIVEG